MPVHDRHGGRGRPTPRKPRLHRLDHVFAEDAIYFVTLCVQPRQRALDNDRVHQAFIAFGHEGLALGCHLGRYVLMPDHVHAFIAFGEPRHSATLTVSAWAKALKGCVSKAWREAGNRGVHWQKGFFDHVLRTPASYAEKWDYVALNPVRAGLVSRPEDWPYQGEICRLDAGL